MVSTTIRAIPKTFALLLQQAPYICCVDKTHLVFRMIFAKNYVGFRNGYEKEIIAADLLLQHNLSEESLKTINAFFATELQHILTWNAGDIAKIITEYCVWENITAEILYPLVIQDALIKRKQACTWIHNHETTQQGLRSLPAYNAHGNKEDLEDVYSYHGSPDQPSPAPSQFTIIPLQEKAYLSRGTSGVVPIVVKQLEPANFIRTTFQTPRAEHNFLVAPIIQKALTSSS